MHFVSRQKRNLPWGLTQSLAHERSGSRCTSHVTQNYKNSNMQPRNVISVTRCNWISPWQSNCKQVARMTVQLAPRSTAHRGWLFLPPTNTSPHCLYVKHDLSLQTVFYIRTAFLAGLTSSLFPISILNSDKRVLPGKNVRCSRTSLISNIPRWRETWIMANLFPTINWSISGMLLAPVGPFKRFLACPLISCTKSVCLRPTKHTPNKQAPMAWSPPSISWNNSWSPLPRNTPSLSCLLAYFDSV